MPLTESEVGVVKTVLHEFLSAKRPMDRKPLLLKAKSREVLDRLVRWGIIKTDDQKTFLPKALSFHYGQDPEALRLAIESVTILAQVLKTLYEGEAGERRYRADEIHTQASKMFEDLEGKKVSLSLGLYLAPEFNLLSGWSGNPPVSPIENIGISEYVVEINPETLWDQYVKQQVEWVEGQVGRSTPRPPSLSDNFANDAPTEEQVLATPPLSASLRPDVADLDTPSRPSWLPKGWKIVDSLPEGGQGWTYRVKRTSESDQTLHVLKRLKNRKRLARFQKEIEALRKLSHPGILRIVETFDNDAIYVAEYCEKGDLAKYALSGVPFLDRLRLYREVCDAMAAAHRANIIHRDLKPQNILVRANGSLAVGDFGLCLDLTEIEDRPTSSLEAVGPRHYMAPELEDGRDPDPKPSSDCYSLGKLLYFILCGRSFARERHAEGSNDLRTSDPNPHLHFAYEVLNRTIATNPHDRYQNATELLRAIDGVIMRIEQDAHVLDMRIPQHCLYCRNGHYGIRLYNPSKLAGFSEPKVGDSYGFWGTNQLEHKSWMVLVCDNCGNTQMFRPDIAGRDNWKNLK